MTANLKESRKPQVIRSHSIQTSQLNSFTLRLISIVKENFIPLDRISRNHMLVLDYILTLIGDAYYTGTTVIKCRRRLGQQYTYTAMFREKDYEQEGVLLNPDGRKKLFWMEIISRNMLWRMIGCLLKLRKKYKSSVQDRNLANFSQIFQSFLENPQISSQNRTLQQWVRYFWLMLFMLGWNKCYNFPQTILKIKHIYTYKNKNQAVVDYRIQGYMLLIIFIIKLTENVVSIIKQKCFPNKKKIKIVIDQTTNIHQSANSAKKENQQLCRICYDQMNNKTATSCGHVFCWQCIIKTIQMSSQCPVCRAPVRGRDCIQLQNF